MIFLFPLFLSLSLSLSPVQKTRHLQSFFMSTQSQAAVCVSQSKQLVEKQIVKNRYHISFCERKAKRFRTAKRFLFQNF